MHLLVDMGGAMGISILLNSRLPVRPVNPGRVRFSSAAAPGEYQPPGNKPMSKGEFEAYIARIPEAQRLRSVQIGSGNYRDTNVEGFLRLVWGLIANRGTQTQNSLVEFLCEEDGRAFKGKTRRETTEVLGALHKDGLLLLEPIIELGGNTPEDYIIHLPPHAPTDTVFEPPSSSE